MLKLFYSPQSCAIASHIALEEAGADYEAVHLDFAGGEQRRDEYLKINPKGRVPALVTDRGILTENPAILLYIAQTHPQAKLAPLDDPFETARMQALNNYLCATVHVAHAHGRRGYRWADDKAAHAAMKQKVSQNMAECFDLMEQETFVGPWAMGEAFSVADPYLFTLTTWLESDGVNSTRFPRIHDHMRRMFERPAVKKIWAIHS